jgi:hypothetical protein
VPLRAGWLMNSLCCMRGYRSIPFDDPCDRTCASWQQSESHAGADYLIDEVRKNFWRAATSILCDGIQGREGYYIETQDEQLIIPARFPPLRLNWRLTLRMSPKGVRVPELRSGLTLLPGPAQESAFL